MRAYKKGKEKTAWEKDMKYSKWPRCIFNPTIFIEGKEFTGRTINDFTKMAEEAAKSGQ